MRCCVRRTQVKISRMRARIAERLKEAQNTAASLTTFQEIDMSQIMSFRSKYKDQVLKDFGVKLGFMSAFVKASTVALRELPAVNGSIEGTGNSAEIVYRDYADISVAVSTPKGLVTPVLRNAESFNFVEIEKEIAELGKKVRFFFFFSSFSLSLYSTRCTDKPPFTRQARDGKLTLEDMTGGTFTMCVPPSPFL
jgi:2-oxoglutarate dehydrogenase E2 component (dihydrolipoamide succinyltransferase)